MTTDDRTPATDARQQQGTQQEANVQGTSTMTPDQAAALLAQAERARSSVPASIPSAVVALGLLCAIGTFGSLALSFAAQVPLVSGVDTRLAVLILLAFWIAASIVLPMLFRAPWRKGLAARWAVYMAAWGLLWVLAVALPAPLNLWMSVLFIPLFAIACGIEAKQARAREEA